MKKSLKEVFLTEQSRVLTTISLPIAGEDLVSMLYGIESDMAGDIGSAPRELTGEGWHVVMEGGLLIVYRDRRRLG